MNKTIISGLNLSRLLKMRFIFTLFCIAFASQNSLALTCSELFSETVSHKPEPARISVAPTLKLNEVAAASRKTLSEYAQMAANESGHVVMPDFTNPRNELRAAKTWTGVEGPLELQKLLPEGAFFIDHQLRGSNGDGLVKTATGSMVHVRAFVGDIGTNMGVSIGAVRDNKSRKTKSFVREDADAVILFVHGGGSNTTGHHVAASIMSYMAPQNIDVVSIDMPWHAEGPRVPIENAKQSIELLRSYITKFVSPSGKPVILVGHSMGGMIADLYMREYPNDNLVTAVVPLSTVADPLPGGSVSQKLLAESEIAKKNLTNPNIPEAERDLGDWLARQNKLSPTCGTFCQVLMHAIEWQVPTENGRHLIPALYIIGDADGLYQGYESAFANGVTKLQNAELKVFSKRRDIKDKKGETFVPIGHLIFDHKPMVEFSPALPESTKLAILAGTFAKSEWDAAVKSKSTDMDLATYQNAKFVELVASGLVKVEIDISFEDLASPETFVLVKNYIQRITGKKSAKSKSDGSPFDTVAHAWANNLIFRQFAKSYVFQYMRPTAEGVRLGQQLQDVNQNVMKLKKDISADPKNETLKAERARLDEISKQLTGILKRKGQIKSGQEPKFQEFSNEYDRLNTDVLGVLTNQRKDLRKQLVDAKFKLGLAEKLVAANVKKVSSATLESLTTESETAFKKMMAQDLKVRILTEDYLSGPNDQLGRRPSIDRLPDSLIKEFELFEQLSKSYQKIFQKLNHQIYADAQSGLIHATAGIESAGVDVVSLVTAAAQDYLAASDSIRKAIAGLEAADRDYARAASRVFTIEVEMAKLLEPTHFSPEYYTIHQLLSGGQKLNLTEEQVSSLLQKIWGDWLKLWSTRIAESNDSLY